MKLKIRLEKLNNHQILFQILEQEGIDGSGQIWQNEDFKIIKMSYPALNICSGSIYLRASELIKDWEATLTSVEDADQTIKKMLKALTEFAASYSKKADEGSIYTFTS